MSHLPLTDNITKPISLASLLQDNTQSQIHAFQDLQTIAGKSLEELCKQNENLLVFPQCLEEHNNGIEELSVCELVGTPNYDGEKISDVSGVGIKTGNLMGFIGFAGSKNHNTKLEIRSRFTKNTEDTNNTKQDYFLHYMLEKVFRINLFDMNYSHSKNDGFDLLYLIFPHLLKRALRQGIFRTYRTFQKNDAAVKGTIDINRHIKQNTPFNGKIAYRSREYSPDNNITQLIRHTIEFLKQKEMGKSLLNSDNDTKDAVKQIVAATDSSYSVQNRGKILYNNLRSVNHPYYSAYKYLQKLCLLILRHQSMQYSQSDSPIYGILFDGAWLWEEYLATILCDSKLGKLKFEHPKNKTGKGGIRLFDNSKNDDESTFSKCYRRIYPDFYRKPQSSPQVEEQSSLREKTQTSSQVEEQSLRAEETTSLRAQRGSPENDGIILDAKYKHLENGFVRDDLYQIISYMHTMRICCGGFVYPRSSTSLTDPAGEGEAYLRDDAEKQLLNERDVRLLSKVEVKTFNLAGLGGTVSTIAFPITQNAESYSDFVKNMKLTENFFMETTKKSML